MQPLPIDQTRCMGLLPGFDQTVTRCSQRATCARYIQRAHGTEQTPVAQWLCPGRDEWFQSYIATEV